MSNAAVVPVAAAEAGIKFEKHFTFQKGGMGFTVETSSEGLRVESITNVSMDADTAQIGNAENSAQAILLGMAVGDIIVGANGVRFETYFKHQHTFQSPACKIQYHRIANTAAIEVVSCDPHNRPKS